jgi:WD40 repeat protein
VTGGRALPRRGSAFGEADGQRIASTSGDYTIRVWDVQSESRSLPEHSKYIDSVAFSLDEQHIAPSQNRTDHVEKYKRRVGDVENIHFMNKFLVDSGVGNGGNFFYGFLKFTGHIFIDLTLFGLQV